MFSIQLLSFVDGNAGFDRIYSEPESKMKTAPARRDPPTKSRRNLQGGSPSAPPPNVCPSTSIYQKECSSFGCLKNEFESRWVLLDSR